MNSGPKLKFEDLTPVRYGSNGSLTGEIEMTRTLHGVIRGKTIELSDNPGLADGASVQIVMLSIKPSYDKSAAGLQRCAGALADDPYWDDIMEEIQQSRQIERRPQEIDS